MARLFEESEWSQEQIAQHVSEVTGKVIRQSYVSRRLTFGRFLKVMPTGHNSGLNERRFRRHYQAACRKYPGKQLGCPARPILIQPDPVSGRRTGPPHRRPRAC
jgi:hypothetical protein